MTEDKEKIIINVNQIFEQFIEPELKRRKEKGLINEDFKFNQALIKFTIEGIKVEFGKEIEWIAKIEHDFEKDKKKGDDIMLHEVRRIVDVSPPEHNGEKVAFIFLKYMGEGKKGKNFQAVFDFTPHHKQMGLTTQDSQINRTLTEVLNISLKEKVLMRCQPYEDILRSAGLWVIPALLPHPLSKIIELLQGNRPKEAMEVFRLGCTPEYIEKLTQRWWVAAPFLARKGLIEGALEAHKNKKYISAIHVLFPQLEGVISDFVIANLPKDEPMPWRQESKTKKFRDLVIERSPISSDTYQTLVNLVIDFIIKGPVLKTFKDWTIEIDKAFPNRHVVEHGKYEKAHFNEENSIKLILLLDTIFWIMTNYY